VYVHLSTRFPAKVLKTANHGGINSYVLLL